jgi:hypothetical protein
VTAQSSRAQAAPLLRVPRGCAHGTKHQEQTRGAHVAPDAAPEQRASSAALRRTLAEAATTLHAQARRTSSRRGARRSLFRLAHHDKRQARSQRAAWRRSAAQRGLRRELTHVRSACRGSERLDTRSADGERLDSRRACRAPEGDSARSCTQTFRRS